MKMFAFAMIILFLTFIGSGVGFSRWGKNSIKVVRLHQVGTSEIVGGHATLTSTFNIDFVTRRTLKRRANISADTSAHLA